MLRPNETLEMATIRGKKVLSWSGGDGNVFITDCVIFRAKIKEARECTRLTPENMSTHDIRLYVLNETEPVEIKAENGKIVREPYPGYLFLRKGWVYEYKEIIQNFETQYMGKGAFWRFWFPNKEEVKFTTDCDAEKLADEWTKYPSTEECELPLHVFSYEIREILKGIRE